ncbi:MAG: NifX-associated nitrogen fixation protein [cyanobacterium endosymbiont of Rhopalodia musculus]|uniref:NifX-associated nitrogen fixation protein n=1 Tax=cyanobacterium endosymbiont of Epithemia clementina EcSB TaxID=3034674 RepID=UPI002480D913|nr:NifX-associated nitrogen fixation protein [cyanobacterium endosymbiont of Epithemia clementina EcSB]WGT67056.1 NifX-associated nitrogen fixation protein [cyanobacterium endosymbiont of Epithemia clementina EcSB]
MKTTTNSEQSTLLVSDNPFLQEVVRQIRAYDHYGVYKSWTNELVLGPYVISKQQKREISLEGDIDPATKLRILCFYRAVASLIEKETAQLCQVIVDLNSEGFGWALVWSGRLMTVCRTLRDAHRFGFDSLEKLAAQGEKITQSGIEVVQRFPEVARF